MSTKGDYSVVSADRAFGCYQHTDMCPDSWPAMLLREAADIAERNEWGEVVAGWTSKAWVDESVDVTENAPPAAVKAVAASHPDGGVVRNRWAHALRPRQSEAELRASDSPGSAMWADECYVKQRAPINGHPSWRAAAAMPVMMKHRTGGFANLQYGVVVDVDYSEIVLLRYRPDTPDVVVMGVAPLHDAATITALANFARGLPVGDAYEFGDRPDLPAVPSQRRWVRGGEAGIVGLSDGMWRRPQGLAPLPGAPEGLEPLRLSDWPETSPAVRSTPSFRAGGCFDVGPPMSALVSSPLCSSPAVRRSDGPVAVLGL